MQGVMVLSEDGSVGAVVMPHPTDTTIVLLYVIFYDLELPPVPIPVKELRTALAVWFG
jgi:hypothetical protein